MAKEHFELIDFSDPNSILSYAKKLEGMTFQQIIDLNIKPNGGTEKDYSNPKFKGGMGELIEERYFGYKANNDARPDFSVAGIELKATPFKVLKDNSKSAKERLVLSMISYKEEYESTDLKESNFWKKNETLLLVYYKSNPEINKLDQEICFVNLFTPPENDLAIIEADYRTIIEYIKNGQAHELSESLTTYLGACTKGANSLTAWQDQAIYNPGTKAKRRAFCYKSSYMTYVLQNYITGKQPNAESILKSPQLLHKQSFEQYILEKINKFAGLTEEQLCSMFSIPCENKKSQRTSIVYKLLGAHEQNVEEFEKGNISVRTVLQKADGKIVEHLPLAPFEFKDMLNESWENSTLRNVLLEKKYLFVVFKNNESGISKLEKATFWSMPEELIETTVKSEWQKNYDVIQNGVNLAIVKTAKGNIVKNNLPNIKSSQVIHLRPHASKRGYLLSDGTRLGNPEKYGSILPNGEVMTRQSFWINNDIIAKALNQKQI